MHQPSLWEFLTIFTSRISPHTHCQVCQLKFPTEDKANSFSVVYPVTNLTERRWQSESIEY